MSYRVHRGNTQLKIILPSLPRPVIRRFEAVRANARQRWPSTLLSLRNTPRLNWIHSVLAVQEEIFSARQMLQSQPDLLQMTSIKTYIRLWKKIIQGYIWRCYSHKKMNRSFRAHAQRSLLYLGWNLFTFAIAHKLQPITSIVCIFSSRLSCSVLQSVGCRSNIVYLVSNLFANLSEKRWPRKCRYGIYGPVPSHVKPWW